MQTGTRAETRESRIARPIIWVGNSNRFSSVFGQAQLLDVALRTQQVARPLLLHPKSSEFLLDAGVLHRPGVPVIWQFDSFDRRLRPKSTSTSSRIFVYHNITPARYFWRSEPKVAFGSLLGQLQLRMLPRESTFVTCSEFNARQLRRMGFCRIQLCPNIVVPCQGAVSASEAAIGRGDTKLVFVGRIAPNKRCNLLVRHCIQAAVALGRRLELTVIGRAKPRCREGAAFRRLVASLGDSSPCAVEWIERPLSADELHALVRRATLYVSAASHEGFGLPVCEAIASGVPALYTRCGGTESVLDGFGMVKIEAEMWKEIAAVLSAESSYRQLLSDQQERVLRFVPPVVYRRVEEVFGPWLRSLSLHAPDDSARGHCLSGSGLTPLG